MSVMLVFISLLCYTASAVHLMVHPSRSQMFEGEPLSLICKDVSAGWTVRRNTTTRTRSQCGVEWGKASNVTKPSCTLSVVFTRDIGVYWCESGDGSRSTSINLTVTGGPVILQSPVLPVMEGGDLTLSCQSNSHHDLSADFYKDGFLVRSGPKGHMTLQHVSRSDEGLYKCSISSVGESPSSWISVTDGPTATPTMNQTTPSTEFLPSSSSSLHFSFFLLRLLIFCPYFISSFLMVSLCPCRDKARSTPSKKPTIRDSTV